MESLPQFEELKRNHDALRCQFISTELDLAITFVGISRSTDDPARAERNLEHARKAVQAAKRYLKEASLTLETHAEIADKLNKLEPELASHRPSSESK